MAQQQELIRKFVQQQQAIMYGPPFESLRVRMNEMALEDLKQIPMTRETADVGASSDMHYTHEFKEQLLMDTEGVINGEYQKWITDRCFDAWAKIEFKGKKLTIGAFGLKSADDCPNRDPTSVKVSYLDEEGVSVEVGKFELNFEQKRHHLLKFKVPTCRTTEMKFDFHHDHHDHFQLNRILFYTADELLGEIEE